MPLKLLIAKVTFRDKYTFSTFKSSLSRTGFELLEA